MAATESPFLLERDYRAVSISHFCVDVLNSSRTLLVAILAISLGLSNAQVGLALILYNVGNALSQPFFGWLADRIGPRLLVVGGVAWMIAFYSLVAVAGDWVALAAITVAGLGSGAFHPSGTMIASVASASRRSQATALFFVAGQLGLFVGPVAAGIILEQFGRPYYLALPLAALFALIAAWQSIERDKSHYEPDEPAAADSAPRIVLARGTASQAILLSLIIVCTGTVSIAAINFAPKFFTELGMPVGLVGVLSGLLMLGSAAGGFVGGTLADRIGGPRVILIGMAFAVLPVYFYPATAFPTVLFLMTLAGFFIGMPHSILVLRAQSLFPGRRAMASGLVLGFMFLAGSLGTYVVGVVADQIGLAETLRYTAILPAIAALLSLGLRR